MDFNNQNNHAGIQRRTEGEKAEALLKLINERRIYVNRFAELPTWDELGRLNKLQNEIEDRYNKEVNDAEIFKAREEYFLMTKRKPFLGWSVEQIREKMEEFKSEQQTENTDGGLKFKKSQWKKALQK